MKKLFWLCHYEDINEMVYHVHNCVRGFYLLLEEENYGSYDNVFEHVSFQIDTDWKLGFVGRNGRGKTTFLNLLNVSGLQVRILK